MNFLRRIWNKIKSFFARSSHREEAIVSSAKKLLSQESDVDKLIAQINKSSDERTRNELIEKVASLETAKAIIEVTSTQFGKTREKSRRLVDIVQLSRELQALEIEKTTLSLKSNEIRNIKYPDTEYIDSKVKKLNFYVDRESPGLELSNIYFSIADKSFDSLEELIDKKTLLKKHFQREAFKKQQEEAAKRRVKQLLTSLEILIAQNRLRDAKEMIHHVNSLIKPSYQREALRLQKVKETIQTRELQILKKQQEEILRIQNEEAERVRLIEEQRREELRIQQEQLELIKKQKAEESEEKRRALKSLLERKSNWEEFKEFLEQQNIFTLYHFTDRINIPSIKKHGGLFSWYYCKTNNIDIIRPGGSWESNRNDTINGKKDYVRLSFTKENPMLFIAQKDGRIENPTWLEIDIQVTYFEGTEFSDKNAAAFRSYTPRIGKSIEHLKAVRFDVLNKAKLVKHFSLTELEKQYNQAEILVKTWIPIEFIKNINSY